LQVFKVLWSEPFGQGNYDGYDSETTETIEAKEGKYGEQVYHSVRRFVIVKERKGHSLCVYVATFL
jgi:uncharacterized protein YdgA (DUF945 family)